MTRRGSPARPRAPWLRRELAAYRSDDGQAASGSAKDVSRYAGWVAELAGLLPAGAAVADLGYGAGIPATRELAGHGLRVYRCRLLRRPARPGPPAGPGGQPDPGRPDRPAPAARQPGRRGVVLRPDPRAASRPARPVPPLPGLAAPGGYLLAITGARRCTETEPYLVQPGSHPSGTGTSRRRLQAQPHPGPRSLTVGRSRCGMSEHSQ
jgi:hypothetical protein